MSSFLKKTFLSFVILVGFDSAAYSSETTKIAISSKNPTHIEALKKGIKLNDAVFVTYDSYKDNFKEPLLCEDEATERAKFRAHQALLKHKADIGIAVENSISVSELGIHVVPIVILCDKNKNSFLGTGPFIKLPNESIDDVLKGLGLNQIINNIMHNKKNKTEIDFVKFFTNNLLNEPGVLAQMASCVAGQYSYYKQNPEKEKFDKSHVLKSYYPKEFLEAMNESDQVTES